MSKFSKDPPNHREAAVVDSLIRKLRPYDTSYVSQRPAASTRPLAHEAPTRAPISTARVWSCVGLGVLVGAALPYWPYDRTCGSWLLLYLVAVGTVLVAGIWGARVSWKGRFGFAHVIAVCTIIWGLALTAEQVLPRVGYAKARLAWRCHDGHAAGAGETRLTALQPVDVRLVELVR